MRKKFGSYGTWIKKLKIRFLMNFIEFNYKLITQIINSDSALFSEI